MIMRKKTYPDSFLPFLVHFLSAASDQMIYGLQFSYSKVSGFLGVSPTISSSNFYCRYASVRREHPSLVPSFCISISSLPKL